MYYDDEEYANKRLATTLVRTNVGTPVFVHSAYMDGMGMRVKYQNLVTGTESLDFLSNIDLTPVPLGFVNLPKGKIAFTCRKPMRKDWKQGLSTASLVIYGEQASQVKFTHLVQPILLQYPSLAQAVEHVQKGGEGHGAAFSRDFALQNVGDLKLVYRKYVVGEYTKGRLSLDKDKFFLEELLTESMR